MMDSILLLGAGGHARACIDVIEQHGGFAIGGLVGRADEVATEVLGYRVLGTDDDLPRLLAAFRYALVAVGHIKTAQPRMRLFDCVAWAGRVPPPIVSPRAYVSPHARIGGGSIVMHGAVVNAAAEVGSNCIINSLALVEHDAVIGDHCHVATAAAVNSGVRVGSGTFLGSNSSVRQLASIGRDCVIGMGQRVLSDCADGTWLPERAAPR